MNLSTDLVAFQDEAIEQARHRDVTLIIFLGTMSVIGVVVNSLLLDVYLHTRRKVLSTYFITAVAAIDLIISTVAMPLRILPTITAVPVYVCAFCLSLSYGCIGVSIMLFFCITFDRYQSVCLLQRPLITTQNLHFAGGWAFVSAVYAGIIAPIYLRGEITVLDDVSSIGNMSRETAREVTILMRPGYPCYSTSMLSHPRRVWDARYVIQFVFAICCGSLIVLVLVLYIMMFTKLRQKDQFRLQSLTLKGHKEAPRELTARPCCDIEGLQALAGANKFQESKSHDKNESLSGSGEIQFGTEETPQNPQYDENDESLHNQNTKISLQGHKEGALHCGKLFEINPNKSARRETENSSGAKNCICLTRSTSSMQPKEILKFRRRIRGKVEPLQDTGTSQSREMQSSPKQSPSDGITAQAIISSGTKPGGYQSKPQQIKVKKCHLLASLSRFRNRDDAVQLEHVGFDNFCSQLSSDTESIQSEPEPCHRNLNINFHGQRSHNSVPNRDDKNDEIDYNLPGESLNTAEVIPRLRSFSCSAAGDTNKHLGYSKLTSLKEMKRYGKSDTASEENLDRPLDIDRLKQCAIGKGQLSVGASPTKKSEEPSDSDRHGVSESSLSTFERKKNSRNSICVGIYNNSGNLRQPGRGADGINHTLSVTKTENDSFSTLTVTVQSKSHPNSSAEGTNTHKGKCRSGKEVGLNEGEPAKTKLIIFKEAPNAHTSVAPHHEDSKSHVTLRQHRYLHGCCCNFEFNLSTRVTARVGLLTLAYCLWWMPFYLTELGLVDYGTLMPEIFFMANVMNPLLHLITSQVFRRQVRARFKVYAAKLAARWSRKSSKA